VFPRCCLLLKWRIKSVALLYISHFFNLLPFLFATGSFVLSVAVQSLFPYSLDEWAKFMALHCLGMFVLTWIAGISFMLIITISVLQLREVLHPAIFGKFIRPQVISSAHWAVFFLVFAYLMYL
jgi:hypothetical protein